MKSLVLAEKPSVARDIARVLKCSKKTERCTGRGTLYCNLGAGTPGHPGRPGRVR